VTDAGAQDTDGFETAARAVAAAFPGANVLDVPGRRLIRLPSVAMAGPWSPASVRGLLVCDSWPGERPRLLVGDELRRDGAVPANFSAEFIAGEAWFGYSFNAPYSPSHPELVPVIRGWLARFDGRSD
jgi:hypothetical protein